MLEGEVPQKMRKNNLFPLQLQFGENFDEFLNAHHEKIVDLPLEGGFITRLGLEVGGVLRRFVLFENF